MILASLLRFPTLIAHVFILLSFFKAYLHSSAAIPIQSARKKTTIPAVAYKLAVPNQ